MSKKIAFIGAGSFGFTRDLVRDILSFPAFRDVTIALMDIDPERLDAIYRVCKRIAEEGKYPATIIATEDRVEALKGADAAQTDAPLHDDRVVMDIVGQLGFKILVGAADDMDLPIGVAMEIGGQRQQKILHCGMNGSDKTNLFHGQPPLEMGVGGSTWRDRI